MKHRDTTRAVHGAREDLRALGVHVPPIDLSTTYPLDDLDSATASIDALVEGKAPVGSPIYARLHNPTVARFEEALANLEGAEAAVAFASGMAALTAALLAARQDGEHIVAVRPLYGGSDHLLTSSLLGLETTFTDPSGVRDAIRPNTSLVILETPANPTLQLVDIADVVAQAGRVPVLVDSTFATPILQNPLAHGATLVLHSATKYLGGHGDVLGGVIATNELWTRRLRQVRIITGAVIHPTAGYALHRGLQTLSLRVLAAQDNASLLARRLTVHPAIGRVIYPGLPGGDPLGLLDRQLRGPGAMIAFEVDSHEAARAVLRNLKLITPAVSLGSVDSLIQHPAGLTHRVVGAEAKASAGIHEGLLRLSVGVEDVEDLWDDLAQALPHASRHLQLDRPVNSDLMPWYPTHVATG